MSYVLNADLTNDYIQSLIARIGYTDVTSEHPDWGLLCVQDLDGNIYNFGDLGSARRYLINEYLIINNG